MKITEVQITPIKSQNGLVAMASVVFDNALFLGSIGVHTKRNEVGYRITYPTKNKGDKNFNIYHPINKEVSEEIALAVLRQASTILDYQPKKSNEYARHCNTNNTERTI